MRFSLMLRKIIIGGDGRNAESSVGSFGELGVAVAAWTSFGHTGPGLFD